MGKAKKPPQLAGITPDQLGALPGSRVIRIEYIDLDDLDKSRAERNAKKHRLDELDASMRRHGYAAPIMVDENTQRIVAGHGRLDTLLQRRLAGREAPDGVHVREGKWLVPVVRGIAFKDPVEAMSYLLADNQIQMLAGYDWHEAHEIAKVVAESSEGLLGTGFVNLAEIEAQMEREVKDLLGGADGSGDCLPDFSDASNGEGESDDEQEEPAPDPTDELVKKWQTAQGQLWEIVGPSGQTHRVLCGDCRNPKDVAKLLGDVKVNIAFTSPPYASQRKYDEESGFKPIHPDKFVDWFEPVQANVRAHLAPDGSWFVNIKEHCEDGERHLYVKDLTIAHKRRWGWMFIDELVWKKHALPGKFGPRFKNGWEPVFHFAIAECKTRFDTVALPITHAVDTYRPDALDKRQGDAQQTRIIREREFAWPDNVISVKQTGSAAETGHSAAFPLALPSFFIKAYSDPGDAIFDPFLGSGTTVLAAEKLGRRGFGTELSAKYLAVILERMTKHGCKCRNVI